MAYNEFTLPKVLQAFGLSLEDEDLFSGVAGVPLPAEFYQQLQRNASLAAAVNTEKAKSEFVIAPILLKLKELRPDDIGLFSGVEFNVDRERGLNGVCDFLISRTRQQHVLTAPVLAIVEAKNDNIGDGIGQCVAAMVAAQQFNEGNPDVPRGVHGAVTIGSSWRFLRLDERVVTVDVPEYFIVELGKIVGILLRIVEGNEPLP